MRHPMICITLLIAAVAAGCGGSSSPAGQPSIAAYVQSTQTHSPEQCHPVKSHNPLYSNMDGYQCVSVGPATQPVSHLKGVPGPVPTVTYWLHLRGTPFIAKTVLDATWIARL